MALSTVLLQSFACMCATIFFGLLIRQPRRSLVYASLIALNGYLIYINLGEGTGAFFAAGFAVGLLCEIAARLQKMATTLFLISGIIPIVPGLALYRSMMALADKDFSLALSLGVQTLINMGAIVIAMTLASLIFTNLPLGKIHKTKVDS